MTEHAHRLHLLLIHERNVRRLLGQLAPGGAASAPIGKIAELEAEIERIEALCRELDRDMPACVGEAKGALDALIATPRPSRATVLLLGADPSDASRMSFGRQAR